MARILFILLLGLAVLPLTPRTAAAQMMPRSVEIGTLTGFYSFVSSGGNDAYKIKLENLQDGLTLGGRVGIHFTEVVGFETSFGILRGRTEDTHRLVWYGNAHVGVDRRASGDSCYVSPLDPVS